MKTDECGFIWPWGQPEPEQCKDESLKDESLPEQATASDEVNFWRPDWQESLPEGASLWEAAFNRVA